MGLGDQMQTVTDRSARAPLAARRLYYLRTHIVAFSLASPQSGFFFFFFYVFIYTGSTEYKRIINVLLYFFSLFQLVGSASIIKRTMKVLFYPPSTFYFY